MNEVNQELKQARQGKQSDLVTSFCFTDIYTR